MPDKLFLSRLESGEAGAQKELIRMFQSRLGFYFSMRIKGDAPLEDLVQEVLARFFESVRQKKLHSDHVVAPYMFGIAKRVLYNFYYQSTKSNKINQKLQQLVPGYENFAENHRLETDNLMEGIGAILRQLPTLDQQILQRFYFQQESIGDIACALKLQRHYVSVRKNRALKRIRREMKRQQLL
ncbi:MAG TPA: sigma-70 family RNA polymerase sigma factor [Candidatus Aminicenantes bacterium]|nr:sigma-70 family RNA polymerase sigma factor [Candidatus Aminicenantes bacterium]